MRRRSKSSAFAGRVGPVIVAESVHCGPPGPVARSASVETAKAMAPNQRLIKECRSGSLIEEARAYANARIRIG